jgi:hypothetical protein
MNSDQVKSLIRSVLLASGTMLTEYGIVISQDQWTAIVGGIMALGAVIWSQWFHKSA